MTRLIIALIVHHTVQTDVCRGSCPLDNVEESILHCKVGILTKPGVEVGQIMIAMPQPKQ